jgi:murein DD-endopeptidase MepM/ murein hydrolase activator NlpD
MTRASHRRERSSKAKSKSKAVLTPFQRVSIGSAVIVSVMAAGWAGYEVGLNDLETPKERLLDSVQVLFDAERRALDGEKREVREHLDALARKLGQMQAEILRLDALGERLVELGGLDETEFNFSEDPAIGGPASLDDVSPSVAEMSADLDTLARRIEDREFKLDVLEDLILSRQVREHSKPAGKPVTVGWVSSHYGWRQDPFTGKKNMHRGLDFAGKAGTEIIAAADGVVTLAEARAGYGKTVEIRHGHGYMTRYAHNSQILVEVGDLVRQGQVIATMGRTGRATGVHLHFEVIRDGKTLNPLRFVKSGKDLNQG